MRIRLLSLVLISAAVFLTGCLKDDAELKKEIEDKLVADGVSGVTVTVSNGLATLSGEVPDSATKTRAEFAVRSVEGIKNVESYMTIKPTPPPPDPTLKAKAEYDLKKAGCRAVVLNVEQGRVIATGTVPAAKFAECVAIIDQAGLGKMENELVIEN